MAMGAGAVRVITVTNNGVKEIRRKFWPVSQPKIRERNRPRTYDGLGIIQQHKGYILVDNIVGRLML